MSREYLGDSVYVDIEGGMIRLTTENGLPDDPSNKIYLDIDVYRALIRYVDRITDHNREMASQDRPG